MARFNYPTIITLYSNTGVIQNKATFTHLTKSIYTQMREDVDYLGVLLGITGANWTDNKYNWTHGTTIALAADNWHHKTYMTDMRTAVEELWTAASLGGSPTWTVATASIIALYDTAGAPIVANKGTYLDFRKKSLYTDLHTHLKTIADATSIFIDAVNGDDTTGTGTLSNPYQTWDKGITVINAAGAGQMYCNPGNYTMSTVLTTNGVNITGARLGDVIVKNKIASSLYAIKCDTFSANRIKFSWDKDMTGDNSYGRWFRDCNGITLEECVFSQVSADTTFQSYICDMHTCDNVVIDHCSFVSKDAYNSLLRFFFGSSSNFTIDNSMFLGGVYGINHGSNNITVTKCGFYDQSTSKYIGSGSETESGVITTDPIVINRDTTRLTNASPYINAAASSNDINGYKYGDYDATTSDAETVADAEAAIIAPATITETVPIHEELTETSVGIGVDMYMGGLFSAAQPSGTQTVTYLTKLTAANIQNANYVYNGAFLDLSFTNSGGNRFECYVTADDGVSDYSLLSWWDTNANYHAVKSQQAGGGATDSYFIDCTQDCVDDSEWGESWAFTTEGTSDGVNDKSAAITLKVRMKNMVTGVWSELFTFSESFYFNDFDKFMYYCNDNPRMLADEYANDANYFAQTYHTGTAKYTRADGVDWIADGRRFAFNPIWKMDMWLNFDNAAAGIPLLGTTGLTLWTWRHQQVATTQAKDFRAKYAYAYVGIYGNFGNWNAAGTHCFTTATNQPYDNATASVTNPVMDTGSTDVHYMNPIGYHGADCSAHSSNQSFLFMFPSGEVIGMRAHVAAHQVHETDEIWYEDTDWLYPSCGFTGNYFWASSTGGMTSPYMGWIGCEQVMHVNTNQGDGSLHYGNLAVQYTTSSSVPYIGSPAF